jgi:hypothetical protein
MEKKVRLTATKCVTNVKHLFAKNPEIRRVTNRSSSHMS